MLNVVDSDSCFLISIEAANRDTLFDCYRDYLVFMSLVRDGVRSNQLKVYGFCWLRNQSLMLIKPENKQLGKTLLRLLKRYHFWLLQQGPSMTEFKLQILELKELSWTLDCIRFLHQQAVNEKVVDDAMDYHWHSYHVYNGFWSVNWLDTLFILDQFASNQLVAMNRFRQYMLHGYRLNFTRMLETDDCSQKFICQEQQQGLIEQQQVVAEINNPYHQSLLERTSINIFGSAKGCYIQIRVMDCSDQVIDSKLVG